MIPGMGDTTLTLVAPAAPTTASGCPAGQYGAPSIPLIGCVDPKDPLEWVLFGAAGLGIAIAPGYWKVIIPIGVLLLRQELGKISL